MLKLANQDIKTLHIEPTDACNAACPQCARETDNSFDKANIHHLTVDRLLEVVEVETIQNLEKLLLCGNYGDPAAGKYTMDILKFVRCINPNITIGMNTNGGLRDVSWWAELANLNKVFYRKEERLEDYVIWSIDGLADTNHLYRVNVEWNKVMSNAQAFIDAGGRAHWEMLVFEHNQHQVKQAEQLAKDMGFKFFRAKVSKRFKTYPVEFLHPPTTWQDPVVEYGNVDCHALKDSSLYLSAKGILYPCCWLGINSDYTLDKFDSIQQSWHTDSPNKTCWQNCAKNDNGTSFTNQWQHEVKFQIAT